MQRQQRPRLRRSAGILAGCRGGHRGPAAREAKMASGQPPRRRRYKKSRPYFTAGAG